MSWKRRLEDTREEMEKDGFDLFEQVMVLITGGVLGGQAYSITQEGYPLWLEGSLYLLILSIGIVVLGSLHFLISYYRVLDTE